MQGKLTGKLWGCLSEACLKAATLAVLGFLLMRFLTLQGARTLARLDWTAGIAWGLACRSWIARGDHEQIP